MTNNWDLENWDLIGHWSLRFGIFMRVAIIGAGTIGLYLGWKLSEKGHQVIIFEKNKKIGNKICSGLFSERILKFIPQSKKLAEKKIESALIHFPRKAVKLKFSKKFFLMSHYQLDRLLLSLAKKSGVKVILNSNVSLLPKNYDKIIGCDGANSFVRKELDLPEPKFRLGILGYIVKKPKKKETHATVHGCKNYVETWPCENGFLWRISRKKEIEYGIMADIKQAPGIFKNFLEKNKIKIRNARAKIIPQGLIFPKNPKHSNITLCGDSAGLTKPWSGGGIIWGLTAADILLKNFPDFVEYQKKTKRFFRIKIILSKAAIKIVYFLGFKIPWLLPKNVIIESDFLL